jgi:hypothetical protein
MASLSNQPNGKLRMFAPYRQVLASYAGAARRWWFWCLLFVFNFVFNLPILIKNWLVWPTLILVVSFVAALLVSWRLSSYRGRLLPGYREAHLAVLATVCLATLVGVAIAMHVVATLGMQVAAALEMQVGVSGDQMVAPWGTLVLAVAAGCWAVRAPIWVAILALSLPQLGWRIAAVDAARAAVASPAIDISLAAAGAALVALFVRTLWNVSESDGPALQLSTTSAWTRLTALNAGAQPKDPGEKRAIENTLMSKPSFSAGVFLQIRDWRLDAALRRGPKMWFWNICRWLLPWPVSEMLIMMPVLIAIVFYMPILMPSALVWLQTPDLAGFLRGIAGFFLFAIATLFAHSLVPRLTMLGTESLRPATRTQFFQQLGGGLLVQWFSVTLVAIGTFWLLAVPHGLIPLAGAWRPAALLVAVQLATLAIALRALRFESPRATIVGLSMVGGLAAGAVVAAPGFFAGWAVSIAGLLAASSAVLLWVAYRGWLVTDLQ